MTNDEGNVVKISSFTHTPLSRTYSERGNVANHLLGKPPNPRRGTSWKRRQTSLFTHTQLSLAIFKGGIRDGNIEGIIRELAN